MNKSILIIALIAVLFVVILVFAIRKYRKQKEIRKKYPGYPKGYWMSQGIGIGIAIGAGIGALNKMGIGIATGIAIGAGIGSRLEKKYKNEIRPMTEEEKELRKQSIIFIAVIFIIGISVSLVQYFL